MDSETVGGPTWPARPLAVGFVYLVAATAMTWPLAWNLTSGLPGGYRDVWQNLWNFWWWKTALVGLHESPYQTEYLFFPFGADLAFHTHSELNQLVFLPISLLFGVAAAHNSAILAGFVLSGFGAWLLARRVGADAHAALLAGFVFAFFPYRMEQSLEHLNLSSTQFLPIVTWSLLVFVAEPTVRTGALLGACFAANALLCWHYALFAALLLPVVFVGAALRGALRGRVGQIVVGALVALAVSTILLAPFAWPMIRGFSSGAPYVKPPVEKGIDAIFLFVPSDRHPLFGPFVAGIYDRLRWSPTPGFSVYLGVVPLFFAIRAFTRDRGATVILWAAIAGTSLLFALGSHPRIGGLELPVPFPHVILESVPGLGVLRVANRFFVVFMLAFSMLVALGASRSIRWELALLACVLTLGEYLWLPYPVQGYVEPRYAPVFTRLVPVGAVLDLPFSAGSPKCLRNQALQTVHGRPIAGGYVSVTPTRSAEALRNDPVLGALVLPGPSMPLVGDWPQRIRRAGFTLVALHKDAVGRSSDARDHRAEVERRCTLAPELLEALSSSLSASGGPPAFEDDRLRLFRLP